MEEQLDTLYHYTALTASQSQYVMLSAKGRLVTKVAPNDPSLLGSVTFALHQIGSN